MISFLSTVSSFVSTLSTDHLIVFEQDSTVCCLKPPPDQSSDSLRTGIIGPIVCGIALLFLVDRVGRKPLLLGPSFLVSTYDLLTSSIVGTFFCCLAMAAEAAIQKQNPGATGNHVLARTGVGKPFNTVLGSHWCFYVSLGMIAVFSIGFSFSYGLVWWCRVQWKLKFSSFLLLCFPWSSLISPISWIYASEVFPNRIRAIGVAASTMSWVFDFFSRQFRLTLLQFMGCECTLRQSICSVYTEDVD